MAQVTLPYALDPTNPANVPVLATPVTIINPDGSSGSGSAITIADGADVTEGSQEDAAYAGTGAASLVAIGKGVYNLLAAPLPAGTNLVGKVGIDQTTPGTTNGVVATGNVANGATDSGNPLKIGGYASLTAPTAVTAGQRVNAWYSQFGSASTFLADPTGVLISFGTASSDGVSTTSNAFVSRSFGYIFNGTAWDRARGTADGASVQIGLGSTSLGGAASTTVYNSAGNTFKASAGNLASINLVDSTVAGYLIVANLTAVPSSGTAITAAQLAYCMPIAASTGFDKVFQVPLYLSAGITILLSTSPTTYTPIGTAPSTLTAQFK